MTPTVISLLVFLAVILAVLTVYSLVRDIAKSDSRRIKKRISDMTGADTVPSRLFQNLSQAVSDPFHEQQAEPGGWKSFQMMVEQAGLSIDAGAVMVRSVGVALTLGILGFLVTRSVWLSLCLAIIGFLAPLAYVLYRRDRRLEQLRSQLADAYSMMGRVMLAGQTSSQAMQLVAKEFSDPIAGEFDFCNEQQNLGLPTEITMNQLAQRTGLLEVKMYVVAAMVHRDAGGNMAEVLENLAQVIRQRFRVRGEVRTLTAEGRFQAAVLLLLPLILFGGMYVINPGYMGVLLDHPWLIAAAGISELIGAIWIRKIVNFDY